MTRHLLFIVAKRSIQYGKLFISLFGAIVILYAAYGSIAHGFNGSKINLLLASIGMLIVVLGRYVYPVIIKEALYHQLIIFRAANRHQAARLLFLKSA